MNMQLTDEEIDTLFESDHFQNKVIELLASRLQIDVNVSNGAPYEQRSNEVRVEVALKANNGNSFGWANEATEICSGSDSVTVETS
jgi:hypothetical protein